MTDIVLFVLIALPALAVYFLKSNAALSFLSLTAGMALSTYAAADVQRLISHLGFWASFDNIGMILTVAPLALTLILVHKAVHGLSKILQLVAGLCTGYLLVLAVLPLLGENGTLNIANSTIWLDLQKAQSYIVGAGVILSLALVWFGGLHHSKKH